MTTNMLRRLTPNEFIRAMGSGKTKPLLLACETPTGEAIEAVVKFSSGCEQGVLNLAREVVAACLAGDLGLPVPEPFIVDIPKPWLETLPDGVRRQLASASSVAFGSRLATGQYAAWTRGHRISDRMLASAAAIFVFDAITQNADRRADNPNCLVRGDDLRIIDHELCFTHSLVIGWKPPWALGGLKALETPGFHIFREQLRGRAPDFGPISEKWRNLSAERLAEYGGSLPDEWEDVGAKIKPAFALIQGAVDNFDACIDEIRRILA